MVKGQLCAYISHKKRYENISEKEKNERKIRAREYYYRTKEKNRKKLLERKKMIYEIAKEYIDKKVYR